MQRFWNKVDTEGDCLVWVGARKQDGYGRFKIAGQCVSSHRYVFTILGIAIPNGAHVLHTCDNPPCVNPSHLFFGGQRDNTLDMIAKGRHRGAVGERNAKSKLTVAQVKEIREKYSDRKTPTAKIAKIYGVSQPMISYILIGKNWKGDF